MSKNFYLDNHDLKLNIEYLNWQELFPLIEPDTSDPDAPRNINEAQVLYHEFLQSIGEYIAEKIDPVTPKLDQEHPSLKDGEMLVPETMDKCIKGLSDMGAMAIPFSRHVGGMNMPWLLSCAVSEMTARADVSLMTYYGFFSGLGPVFQIFALEEGSFEASDFKITKTRFDQALKDAASGYSCGAMCLTEPQAGSDLAQIRTKATLGADGYWYLDGQKIWITCGHGEHHLVLARSEDEKTHPGLKGLSLFYVPAHIERDGKKVRNFEIGGQEKKMGQPSMVTVTLNYDQSRGELVGQRGHGFRCMALVMNDARLQVGFEGIGLCESAMRMAKSFADERITMGKKISKHEMIAEYLDEMAVTNKALRVLAFDAAFHEEMVTRLKTKIKIDKLLSDEKKQELEALASKHRWAARLATPLVKYTASENAVRYARMNMQIMGGSGYMKEYKAEKLMRDSLIMPIYEGTSQIQALMVVKDHLQHAMRNPGKFLSKLAQAKLQSLAAKTEHERLLFRLKAHYYSTIQTILTRMCIDKFGDIKGRPLAQWKEAFLRSWDPKKDFSFALLHAERFCKIASDLWMAKALISQTEKIKEQDLKERRLALAMRFMERAEPKIKGLMLEIEASRGSLFREKFLKKNMSEAKTADNSHNLTI